MGALLNWNSFRNKYDGREQEAFEKLAYILFCRKYELVGGVPRRFNQWYIENDPVQVGDDYIGFQAKYYGSPTVNDAQAKELASTVRNAHRKYKKLTVLQIYLANEFSDGKDAAISKRQEMIEKVAEECDIRIEWVLPSNLEIILNEESARNIKEYFFPDVFDYFRKYSEQLKYADLPDISARIKPTCEPYIEDEQRREDVEKISSMIKESKQAICIYGEGGIGKTQLVLRYAEQNPQNEYIFVKFKGSINQTISSELFFLSEELSDLERFKMNLVLMLKYCNRLKADGHNLVLIIDNYDPDNYEKTFYEMISLNLDTGFSGVENDLQSIKKLLSLGVRVILTTRTIPGISNAYKTYKVREMAGKDLLDLFITSFNRITPIIDSEQYTYENYPENSTMGKLIHLIHIAESNTVFITIMALAMQNSQLEAAEALESMCRTLKSDVKYQTDYANDTLRMQDHFEKVLKFMGLPFQSNQVLGALAMLPPDGMDLDLYKTLILTEIPNVKEKRQECLERFINNSIAFEGERIEENETDIEDREKELGDCNNDDIEDLNSVRNNNYVNTIYMHPLVAKHALKVLYKEDKRTFFNKINMNWTSKLRDYISDSKLEKLSKQDKVYRYLSQIAKACAYAEASLKDLDENNNQVAERRSLLLKASDLCNKKGYYKDAIEYLEKAICVGTGHYHADLEKLMKRIYSVASFCYYSGNYNESIRFNKIYLQLLDNRNRVVSKIKALKDYHDPNLLIHLHDAERYSTTFNNLAISSCCQGEYAYAAECCKISMEMSIELFGPDHIFTSLKYHNIAGIYADQGYYSKALEYYKLALAIRKKAPRSYQGDLAITYECIAAVYTDLGRYVDALIYCKYSLEICEKLSRVEDRRNTADTYNVFANVYRCLGKYNEAMEYFRKALDIKVNILGENHPDIAATYYGIAKVYKDQGEYSLAMEYYRKSLEIEENMLGKEHPNTASTYCGIATVHKDQHEYVEAMEYYGKALEIQEKKLGEEHPKIIETYNGIAGAYNAQGKYAEAMKYYEKALVIRDKVLGEEHPDISETYHGMASVYLNLTEYSKALDYYEKALFVRIKKLGREHVYTKETIQSIEKVKEAI